MKRFVSLMLVSVLAVALWACGGGDSETTPTCTEGEIADCVLDDGGAGKKTCTAEGWTACQTADECEADDTQACTTTCDTAGVQTCEDGMWSGCQGATPEDCNGLDDDCDGEIDEGLANKPCVCGAETGTKSCVDGQYTKCSAGDENDDEICDNKDNNCNGKVDEDVIKSCNTDCGEGHQVCEYGEWSDCDAPEPKAEICNGEDDDCNGEVDDGLADITCGEGECEHTVPGCVNGQPGDCDPLEGKEDEICDGLDNDCNGLVDDGDLEGCCTKDHEVGEMAECSKNEGLCEKGTWTCQEDGNWSECTGVLPTEEICDGEDNDCDGETDEDNPGGGTECGSDVGECEKGIEVCLEGAIVCQDVGPEAEICDGKDNNCDEQTDEGLTEDEWETNETCDMARELEELHEDAEEPQMVAGTLYKADLSADEDWFKIRFKEATDVIPPCWDGIIPKDVCYLMTITLDQPADVEQTLCIKVGDCDDPEFETCADNSGAYNDQIDIGWKGSWGWSDDKDVYTQITGDASCKQYSITVQPYSICPNEGLCPWEEGYVAPGE